MFSAFLSDLWWVRQDTITELRAKILLSFLNCVTIILKGKSSGELPSEITSTHRHTAGSYIRARERGQQVGPKAWSFHNLDFYFDSPIVIIKSTKQNFWTQALIFPAVELREQFLGLHICWNPSSYSFISHSYIFCIFQLCELYGVSFTTLLSWLFLSSRVRSKDYLDWRFRCCNGPNGISLFDSLTVISDWFFNFLMRLWTQISFFL